MANSSPHVLVVDDSPVDCLVASRVLKTHNIRVSVVDGPIEALKFLDVKSPKKNHIPVVITCSDNNPKRAKKFLDEGAKEYILKAIKVADVPHMLNYI